MRCETLYINIFFMFLQFLLNKREKEAHCGALCFNYNSDCFCLHFVSLEIHFSSVVCHSQDKASISLLLLKEDCSELYIWCLSAITMWFGGLELSFIYERHIALKERDNIFKWVKGASLRLCFRWVTKSIRCPCLLSDCVEQKWSVLDLYFLFWRGGWCRDFWWYWSKKEEGGSRSKAK